MAVFRDAHVSWARGEVSDDIRWRSDLAANRTGLRKCRNMLPRPQGGVSRRGGTEVIAYAKADAPVRLLPFRFGGADAVMIELGAGYARFHTAAGSVMSGATPHEVATPYDPTDIFALQAAQSGDVQWQFSRRRTKRLVRTAAAPARFEMRDAQFGLGPFLAVNDDPDATIQASAPIGVDGAGVTLTASVDIWTPEHVGALFRLDEKDWSATPQWVGNVAVTAGARVRFDGKVYEAVNAGTTSPNPPRHDEGDQADSFADGAVVWRYRHEGFGVVRILEVFGPRSAQAAVRRRLPDSIVDAPTDLWREGAFSDVRGWPRVGGFYQGRLLAAATASRPFALHLSAIQGFDDFALGDLDDAAISRDLIEGEVNAIQWVAPGYVLTIGTTGPEWVAKPPSGSATVTPSAFETRSTTSEGVADVQPARVDDRLLFVDASRRNLISHFYDFATDAYAAEPLTLFSEHILAAGVTAMAWQKRPNRALWLALGDGMVASFTYDRRQEVAAWAAHDFGGFVESVATMPDASGERDELWLVVRRGARRVIERLVSAWPFEFVPPIRQHHLDGAVRRTGAAVASVSGLAHFEGEDVVALIDGAEVRDLVVTGGRVDLPFAGGEVLVGKPYRSALRTLPFDLGQVGQSLHAKRQHVTELAILMGDFVSGFVSLGDSARAEIAPGGAGPDGMTPPIRNGAFPVRLPRVSGGSADMEIELTFEDAYCATVRGIVEEREV